MPSQQVPVSAPMYPNPSTQAGTKFVNVVKPQLNQQAIKSGLMSSLRAQQQQRIPATVTSGLMAASGVLLGIGLSLVMLNVVDSGYDEPNFFVAALVGVFCLFLGWAVSCWLPEAFKPAGVAAVNILVPVTAIASLAGQLAEGNLGVVLLFAGVLSAILWVLPGTAGRPSIQALGIAYLSFALIVLSVQSRIRYFVEELSDFEFSDPLEFLETVVRDSSTLSLILGAVLIGVGHRLDRKNWSSVATPFLANGIVFVLAGAWSLQLSAEYSGSDSVTGSVILLVLVSAGLTFVGGYAGRRFTLGLGTWLIAGGLVLLVVFVSGDSPSVVTIAVLMLIFASAVSFAVFKAQPSIAKWTTKQP